MKSNLMLSKYNTQTIQGTFNLVENKTYFGSKMIKMENNISILDNRIQYTQIFNDVNTLYNGYQYKDYISYKDEKIFLKDLSVLKNENTNIELINKDSVYKNNTIWEVTIDYNNILREYLFLKLKEKRAFKCVIPQNLINKNINQSIYQYIDNNLLDRFNIDHIDFYVKVYEIQNNNNYHFEPHLLFNPIWNKDVYNENNLLKSVNLMYRNNKIIITYNQDKSYDLYKFDYYYNIFYIRT